MRKVSNGFILVLLLSVPFTISVHEYPLESIHTDEHAGSDVVLLEDFYNIGTLLMEGNVNVNPDMLVAPVLDGHEGLYNIERAVKNCYNKQMNCIQAREGLGELKSEVESMKKEPSQ